MAVTSKAEIPSERVISAVKKCPQGRRIVAADLASVGGLPLEEAQAALVTISAFLPDSTKVEVDEDGQVAYTFSSNIASAVREKSRTARWRARWTNHIKPVLGKVGKTLFGVGLVVNVVTVWTLVMVMVTASSSSSSSSSSNDNSRDRRRSSSSSSSVSSSLGISAFDIMSVARLGDLVGFTDRANYYESILSGKPPPSMGTLESGQYSPPCYA
jgi:hypothetical protein